MAGSRFGIARSLLMLLLGLTLIASMMAPAPAWAEDTPEIPDPEAVAAAAADEAAAKAAEEAAAKLAEMSGEFFEKDAEGELVLVEDAPVLKAGVADLMAAIAPGDMEDDVFAAAVTAGVVDPYEVAGISREEWVTNNLWIMIAGMLVFMMHLGFACVESGLTSAKNTVNILFKNTAIVMIGIVTYGVCGWMIMYPGDFNVVDGVFSFNLGIGGGGVFYSDAGPYKGITPVYNTGYTVWTDFFFQAMFAATCCTIVSGAVAGRVKLLPFLIFCPLFVAFAYCVVGSWKWGGGWLYTELADGSTVIKGTSLPGFLDYAGSTLVHAVGGAGALAGALLLGPRLGKYAKDGSVQPIPGHSMPLATIGVVLLWFGWFGFNGGSELSADPAGVSYVLVTTTFAACGGGLAAAIISWIFGGKPDLSMTLNGILAGLVGITAGPDIPSWFGALVICGMIPGVLVYFAVLFFDKIKIDDPVGAISVHGVCGIYGTLACGFSAGFNGPQFTSQLIGTGVGFVFAFAVAAAIFLALKVTLGLRVSAHEEIEGLDLGEHDMSAYPDFQHTFIKSYHAREI